MTKPSKAQLAKLKRLLRKRHRAKRRQRSLGGTPEDHAAQLEVNMLQAKGQAQRSYMSAGGAYDCQDALESLGRAAFSLGLADANSAIWSKQARLPESTPASQAIDKAFDTVIKFCVRK